MADGIRVLAGDWQKATLSNAGFKLSQSAFGLAEYAEWKDLADLSLTSADTSTRTGDTAFKATLNDSRMLFASCSASTFHKIQTAYIAQKVSAERGTPPPKPRRNVGCMIVIAAVVALPVLVFISNLLTPQPTSMVWNSSSIRPATPTKTDDNLIAARMISAGEDSIRELLKDPDSAQFQNVTYQSKTNTVCGEVNAKNGFGGYSGFSVFFSLGGAKALSEIRPVANDRGFVKTYNDLCTK